MDVTNPGQVTVEDEVYANPDPNGGSAQEIPRNNGVLVPVANYARKPADNDVDAETFATPAELFPDVPLYVPPVGFVPVPAAPEIVVANQCLTGVNTPDFTVVGPAESFQTNATTLDMVTLNITGVYDADNMPAAPSPTTTRYYLLVATPPLLTSYPVSLLGRQVIFTSGVDEGGARFITGYGSAYLVINRQDDTENDGGIPSLDAPSPGDTLSLNVARLGSEQVNDSVSTIDVFVSPPPPVNVPMPSQGLQGGGTVNVSTGAQPAPAPVVTGTPVPKAYYVEVIDQPIPYMPANVFV